MSKRKFRGASLTEVLIGVAVSALIVFGGLSALVATAGGWSRGQAKIDAELEAVQAMRLIRDTLREAMLVSVDADGRGITYRLPLKDDDGNYIQPAQWDGVVRRFEVRADGKLYSINGGVETVIVRGVSVVDPRNGNEATYSPFTAGPGGITRQVTVQIVTQRQVEREGRTAYGRNRETVILRNTPTLIN